MLFNNDHPELHDKIRAYYHLPSEAKILLYAPTYRESKAASDYLFDCKAIQSALSEKFGGNWFILFRTHYFVMNQLSPTIPLLCGIFHLHGARAFYMLRI